MALTLGQSAIDAVGRQAREGRARRHERMFNGFQRIRYVAHGEGYVMARIGTALPMVFREAEWLALPIPAGCDCWECQRSKDYR